MSNTETKDNPYIAIVARKHRNLKKKLEKIVKLESNVASGKVLDEEQLILYSSKNSVEKAIADIGQLKDQLEEVSVQELALTQASKVVVPVVESNTTEEVSTETFSIEQSSTSTQYETEEPKAHVTEATSPIQILVPVVDSALLESAVKKLLKVFHVCIKYSATTGQKLPSNVDYFGQTLLGQTSLGGFDVALEGSLRSAGTYLNDDLSNQTEFMRGFSYSQMADLVDSLAHDMSIGNNNLSFASLSGAVDKLQKVSSPVPQQTPPAPIEEEEEEEEPVSHEEVIEQPVYVQEEIVAPVVQEVERQQQTRRPPARERGPPRVNTQPTDGPQSEQKDKDRRERTPRERTRKPVAGSAATTEHPPEHQTGKRDFGAHVPKPVHDVVVEEHAARHAHPDGKESAAAAGTSAEEKRKRGPRPPRKAREPREGGDAPAAAAAPAPQTHDIAAVHKPVVHAAAAAPSGPPAKVWGGDNKIKTTHTPADASRPAQRSSTGPHSDNAAGREHASRPPRPAAKSSAVGGSAPSSGDRFRNSSATGAPRPPRPPRDATAASGDASSGPPPARRPPQTSGGAPRPPRPSGPPANGGERKPQAARPPKPVAANV